MSETRTVCEACEQWVKNRYGCNSCGSMIGDCCFDDVCAKCGGSTEPRDH